jgi:transposase
MTKRRNYSPEFKAKVALSAIRGDGTISELSSRYGINANLISRWKQEAMDSMKSGFQKGSARHQHSQEAEIEKLHAKIGQLVIEKDFLSRAFKD